MYDNTIILIGVGHILEKSVREVGEEIEREKPDVVAVELCESRYRALKGEVGSISVRSALNTRSIFLIISQWLLARVQRKIGRDFGVEPGSEMLAAIRKAEEIGCEVALVDRDIRITIQRFWKKMKFPEKMKMIGSMVFALTGIGPKMKKNEKKIERITDDDIVSELLKELREFSPGAATALLDERDAYIAGRLLEIAKVSSDQKIVAVVGAGHIQGIRKYLSNGIDTI